MIITFILSVVITIIGCTLLKKCKIDAKYRFLLIMGIGLLSLGILVFPLLDFKDNSIKLINAFISGIIDGKKYIKHNKQL